MRISYRLTHAASLLSVSDDTLRRWADGGRVATETDDSGHRVIAGPELARLATELAAEASRDAVPVLAQSTRNRFPGIVTRVLRGDVAAQVEVQCGPHRVVSLLTTEAVDELELTEGMVVVAAVKSTNVIIEAPAGGA